MGLSVPAQRRRHSRGLPESEAGGSLHREPLTIYLLQQVVLPDLLDEVFTAVFCSLLSYSSDFSFVLFSCFLFKYSLQMRVI